MEENNKAYQTVDEYIALFAPEIKERLLELRKVIREAAPDAQEKISWQMPTYVFYGNLIHFAAHKNHIGLYPAPSGIEEFQKELVGYKQSKGAVQFPNNKPIPYELIGRMVKFRAAQNLKEAQEKGKIK